MVGDKVTNVFPKNTLLWPAVVSGYQVCKFVAVMAEHLCSRYDVKTE